MDGDETEEAPVLLKRRSMEGQVPNPIVYLLKMNENGDITDISPDDKKNGCHVPASQEYVKYVFENGVEPLIRYETERMQNDGYRQEATPEDEELLQTLFVQQGRPRERVLTPLCDVLKSAPNGKWGEKPAAASGSVDDWNATIMEKAAHTHDVVLYQFLLEAVRNGHLVLLGGDSEFGFVNGLIILDVELARIETDLTDDEAQKSFVFPTKNLERMSGEVITFVS